MLEVNRALDNALEALDAAFSHPSDGKYLLRQIVRLRQAYDYAEPVVKLIDELAEAVDNSAEDIGGSRPHRVILDELLNLRGIAPRSVVDPNLVNESIKYLDDPNNPFIQPEDGAATPIPTYAEIIDIVKDCRWRQTRTGESDQMLAKWISEGINALYRPKPSVVIPDTMKCVVCAGKVPGCFTCHGTRVDLNELNTALQDYEEMLRGGKQEGLTQFWHDTTAKEAGEIFRVTIHVLEKLRAPRGQVSKSELLSDEITEDRLQAFGREVFLAQFLGALDEWGCEDNNLRARAIVQFIDSGYDLSEYKERPDLKVVPKE